MKTQLKEDMHEDDDTSEQKKTILMEERPETRQSYLMLMLYMLFISSSGYNVLYVQPIARSMKKAFEVQDNDLSILLTLGSISSSLAFLPLIYIVVMRGIKVSCLVGLGLLTLGTVVELFIDQNFNLIYLGHVITHAGSPVFNIANAKFASIWFGPKTRPLAITLNAMSSNVGLMLAFIVPGQFVKFNPDFTQDEIIAKVRNFHYFLLCLYGSYFLICLFFFKEAPAKYETYKKEEEEVRKNFKMFRQIWELVREPTYVCFVLVIGIGVTSVVINQLLIVQMMTPFNFTQPNCQVGGALMVLGGLIGSVGYSKLFIQRPNQLMKLKLLYLIILLDYAVYAYVPSFKSLWALFPACFFLGFIGMMQVAIALESLVKYIVITGPQRIVIGTGLVQIVLSFSNGAFSFALRNFLMEGTVEGVYKINITIMSSLLLTFVLSSFLQIGFEKRIGQILQQAKGPSLLPKAPVDMKEVKKNKLVASLAALED